jgi:predicted phage terminase large subunit-like protein
MNAGGNAANKTGEIRNHFLRGKALRRLFPEHAPTTRAEEGSRSRWRSPANRLPQEEATVTAAGVGSQKGGTSQHYDIVLADDFWDERSVTNAEKTAKVRKDMAGIEYLLAAPSEGIILYIGTRFAHDDPTAKLLKNPVYECIIASGITPAGRALFPEVLGLVHMLGQAEEVYVFSCQVMLNPTKDTMGFQREWFRYDSYSDLRRLELLGKAASRRVIVCDAAVTDDEESDCIAVMCLAIDHLGRVWVIDYVREKMQPSEFVEELYRMWDKWLPELLARQKSVVETTIMSFLRQREEDRRAKGKSPMRIYDYALRQRIKKLRITAALQPRFVRHEVIFDRDLPHRAELEQELLDHPNSQKDDGIDALSMIDDPVISKKPSFHPVLPPEPEPGPPTAGDYSALETAQRRAEAQAAFARLKGRTKGRHGRQRRRRR